MSPRKLRNHKQVCFCDGWWFPHRIYSRASDALRESHGTDGCKYYREKKR